MEMSAEVISLYSEKCRLCLANPGVLSIFQNQDLQHDIFACTGVKVFSSSNLPEKICTKCSEIVLNAKELRLLATENDKKLKLLFRNDDDDDSRDTLCLENYSTKEDYLLQRCEPVVMVDVQEKNMINFSDNTDSKKVASIKPRKLEIRKDLFDSRSTYNTVKVKTKEDYDRLKKNIKKEPNVVDTVIYECEICEKEFETYKKLYLHTRLHNKKMFCPLDICGKRFATKGDLEKHLRTHTGVRPYTCTICDKSFTQQGTLKSHKENVHYCFIVP